MLRSSRPYTENLVLPGKRRKAAGKATTGSVALRVVDRDFSSQQVLDALPAAIYTCDAQGRVTLYNQAAAELWGREPEIGKDLWCGSWKIYHPDGRPMALDECPMAVTMQQGHAVVGAEIVVERPDHTRVHIQPHPRALFDNAGVLVGAVNMLIDVTDSQRAEQRLWESELAWRMMFETSPVAQMLQLPFSTIANVNDKCAQLLGYTKAELEGCPLGELGLYADARQAAVFLAALKTDGMAEEIDLLMRCKDGSQKLVIASSCQVSLNGTAYQLHSFVDITERSQAVEASRISQLAMASISQGVLIAGPDRLTLSVNPAFEAITGYSQAELVGRSCAMLQGAQTSAGTVQELRSALAGELPFVGELLNYRKDGTTFWNELSVNPVFGPGGALSHFVGVLRDVTEGKALQTQVQLAARVCAQARDGVMVTNQQHQIVMVNQAFSDMSGYSEGEVLGKNPRQFLASQRHDEAFHRAMAEAISSQGEWQGEIWNQRKDGTQYPLWLTVSVLRNARGEDCNYVSMFNDVSEQKAANERINWLSHFDALTGLPNRKLLADRCTRDMDAARTGGHPLAMMVLGVDHFKTINDTQGHTVGDEVLKQFALRVSEALEERDTVARIGGDEFVALLRADTSDDAVDLAGRLTRIVSQPYWIHNSEVNVTASIGVAMYNCDGQDFETLFKSAQVAMHQAKQLGGGKYRLYSAEMLESSLARVALLAALRPAAALGQMQLHYQPFVDLQTGRTGGMEALLRWNHPELGPVPPSRFIPIAEQSGLIVEIGAWVFRQACKDMRHWLDQGVEIPPVSVNISPVQFRDATLLPQIEALLAEFSIEPGMICLEVTEGALMEDVKHSELLLNSLKAIGLKLSLDDFGTGYSSLSYLKQFPFDKVKIDQSFVQGISKNSQDAVIAKVVISMAHGLGLRVIAEGVETEVQCEFMRANMCDEIQGFFFSRAIPMAEMQALLLADRRLPAHLVRVQTRTRTLLLVDDEPNVLASLKRLLRRDGYQILTADNGIEGLQQLAKHPVDIIVSDQRMPGMTGVEFLRQAKALYPDTVRIVLSGYTELQSVTDAINEGSVYRFLTKPWDDDQLRNFITEAFRHKELADENENLNLKIRTANQELATSNRLLQEVLDRKKRKIKRREISLNMVREALQCIPVPVIGLDDDGLIAFVNTKAQELYAGALLGCEIAATLPELDALLAMTPQGEYGLTRVDKQAYRVQWQQMGERSTSSGRIVTLTPAGVF